MKQRYDIVIAGGGMVGISLALACAQALGDKVSILIAESRPLPAAGPSANYQGSFDARSTALGLSSREIFEAVDIWGQLAHGVCAISSIHVSTRGRPGSTLLDAAGEGMDALGYVVENQWLGRVLQDQMSKHPNIEWCAPASVRGMRIDAHGQRRVELETNSALLTGERAPQVELLVIADGANSMLARSLGVAYEETDYAHSAVIANVLTGKAHSGRAFERFTDQGPVALLPLRPVRGRSRSALVWTLPSAMAKIMLHMGDEAFLEQLQERFGYRLGVLERVGERFCYPLKLVEAVEQVRSGVVLMGNAAHSLHPVAGQGFNLALRDVAHLVEVLAETHPGGSDFGELSVLERYVQGQRPDQRRTTLFSDRVSEVFALNQPLVAVARDLGLAALDVVTPAKSWFVRQATGLSGSAVRW